MSMQRVCVSAGGLALLISLSSGALAQVPAVVVPPAADAAALQQRHMEEERRRREAEREMASPQSEAVLRPSAPAEQPASADQGVRFALKDIRFSPSEILEASALQAIAADYVGKQVALSDLRQLVERVNALYRAKEVVTAVATIAQQDVTDGVLEVRLVEGRVGAIQLQGNASTKQTFIAQRLGLAGGDLVDLPKLEKHVDWFNRSSDVRLQASLGPGAAFGTTDLIVAVAEPSQHEAFFSVDNMGSELTGEWRTGLSYRNRSVLGWRDDMAVSFYKARGQDSWALSYAVPVNRWGGRVSWGWYDDRTKILRGDLASLNISGKSSSQVLMWRQPVWMTAHSQWDMVAGAKRRSSSNYIESVLLQNTDSRDHSLGAEWLWSQAQQTLSFSGIRYWTTATQVERERAVVDRFALRYSHGFWRGLTLRTALSWQTTKARNLNSGEQFYLGGEGSVRGYPVGTYSGDRGQTLNVELHHPLLQTQWGQQQLLASGFLFVDYGRVTPYRPPQSLLPAQETLSGIGWGVNSTLGARTSMRVVFAKGLKELPQQKQNYQVTMQLMVSLL